MKVSVVTPNYNGLKFLNNYFETLLIQSRFIEEIIIIDNASTDGSIEFIEEFMDSSNYPIKIVLIKNEDNLGFAPAVNQGIRQAKSEYIYSVNNDVELEWNALDEIIKAMDESIDSGENPFSIQSKMIQHYNRNLIDDAGDEYTILAWTKKLGDGQPVERYNEKREIFSSCAGAALYRKSVLEEIGLFDDDFFALFDEVSQWKREIREGCLLRILKYVGAYDGSKIDRDRLLTALRVVCFIARYSDNRNGDFLTVKGGSLMIPYDDVARLERFVRTAV